MPAADLGPIDAVLLTHDHHDDNLDAAGRALLAGAPSCSRRSSARAASAAWPGASRPGHQPPRRPGRPTIEITATPCRHGPPLSRPIVGEVVGFALRWDGQEHGVFWISGDTVLYDGVRQVAERLDVGPALLHLGGVQFPVTGPVRYTMTARRRGRAVRPAAAPRAIPVHYEGWSHFRQGRAAIERELAAAPDDVSARLRRLPIGEPAELVV